MLKKNTVLIFALYAWLVFIPDAQAVWNIETVDSIGDVGWYCSLALDGSGRPRIAYYDNTNEDLKYASWNGTSWVKEIVDGSSSSCGEYCSLALASSGNPRIAYKNNSIRCAIWTGAAWSIQNTGDTMDVGFATSIAVGTDNSIHIGYSNSSYSSLHYSKYNGSTWSYSDLTASGPMDTAIILDTDQHPHLVYADNNGSGGGDVLYKYFNGTSWITPASSSATPENDGYWPAIKLDSSGNPHISYCRYSLAYTPPSGSRLYNGDLRYRSYSVSGWGAVQTVEAQPNTFTCVGWFSSLALDNANHAHISYHDHQSWCLKYATNAPTGSAWVTEKIDSATYQYGQTSIALDSGQNPHIAYYDISNKNLKYAHWINGSYSIGGTIREGSTPKAGVYVFLSGNNINANGVTDSNGIYAFSGIPTGTYSIVPMLAGWSFSPTQLTFSSLSQNYTNQDFIISPGTGYFIRGYVTDNQGLAVNNVVVKLSGSSAENYTTGNTGYYEFTGLASGGNYTITPMRLSWTFTPEIWTFNNLSFNQENPNFNLSPNFKASTAAITTYTIEGYLKDSQGKAMANINLQLAGANFPANPGNTISAQGNTNIYGFYQFSGLATADYSVTAIKTGLDFIPTHRSYSQLNAYMSNQDFLGVASSSIPKADELKLVGNLFNPAKGELVTIYYQLKAEGKVTIKIYSLDGILVKTLVEENQTAGLHYLQWNGSNQNNATLASGIYLLEMKTPQTQSRKKICLVK